jgi:hypothetical protein
VNGAELTARLAKAMTEARLSEYVRVACQHLGLLAYHTHNSRFSAKGYPDWHILGPNGSLYRELKTEAGRLAVDQVLWLEGLTRAGYNADTWRPQDWYSGRIVFELTELSKGFPDGPGGVNRAASGARGLGNGTAALLDNAAGTDRAASADGPRSVGGA